MQLARASAAGVEHAGSTLQASQLNQECKWAAGMPDVGPVAPAVAAPDAGEAPLHLALLARVHLHIR